jgi:hypothetical protein
MGEDFKELTLHKFFEDGGNLAPEKMDMFFLACYHVDGFRDFLFRTSFFDKFVVEDDTRKRIKEDDVELLKFGYRWLRFAFFGEETLRVRDDVLEAKKTQIEKMKFKPGQRPPGK